MTSATTDDASQRSSHVERAPGLAEELAARVAALSFDDVLDSGALPWARAGILDTLGVALAGAKEDAPQLAAQALELSAGPALLWGSQRRVGVLDAALVNGTAAHALDFDDSNNTMGGHPSAPLLSALFGLAEQGGHSGAELVTAYVTGFETQAKLGLAVNFHHYTKGWHPSATLGTFGVAAACAKLMGLDTQGIATALALAASFASGLKANFGTMTKPLHIGHCARNGLYAARLAKLGFTANTASVFEDKQGFLDVFNGPGTYDIDRMQQAWARPLDIVEPGIAFKQYPCCGSTHSALDAMLELVGRHQPSAGDVERIEVWTHSRRLAHTDRPRPNSSLDAKFSLQYVLARALLDGWVGVDDFLDSSYQQAEIQQLLPKIHANAYDKTGDSGFDPANHFGGRVRITLRNGTVLESRVAQPLGRTTANPLSPALLRRKFSLCVQHVLDAAAIPMVADLIDRIEMLTDISDLTALISQATLSQKP